MSHARFLELVRAHELALAMELMPRAKGQAAPALLEIGAGTGQQAASLQACGYRVTAVDVPQSHYRHERQFPVIDYDGQRLPADDASFDLVFSSNTLEHIPDTDGVLSETYRVLKDDGLAIHILPSVACRLWTYPSHYVWLARRLLESAGALRRQRPAPERLSADHGPRPHWGWPTIAATFFPSRHGEHGNVLTEAYYYRERWWVDHFAKAGMEVTAIVPNGVFYTMSNALTTRLPLATRQSLAKLLGSACKVYVTRKKPRGMAA